jgi:fermentation-respiration switch protein FrsA (DUF1100 family)
VGRVFFRANLANVRPIKAIPSLAPRPVLFIHGAEDHVIPAAETIELYLAAGNKDNRVWIVQGAGHVKAYRHRPEEYVQRVTAFFQRYIS